MNLIERINQIIYIVLIIGISGCSEIDPMGHTLLFLLPVILIAGIIGMLIIRNFYSEEELKKNENSQWIISVIVGLLILYILYKIISVLV